MHMTESLRLALLVGFLGMGFGAGRWTGQTLSAQEQEAPATAADFSQQFQAVARKVAPSVVSVKAYFKNRRDRLVLRQEGSGVLLRADGLLVTNHHVVMHADRVGIVLASGREVEGRVVGRDPDTDLALVRIEAEDLQPAELRSGDAPRVGEWVLAIGNPYGLGSTVTAGIISGLGRRDLRIATYEDFIQTDAAINPGNSGGPLVDLEGRVVGINTAVAMPADVSNGLGFAIPSSMVERVVESLLVHGRVIRGFLGIDPTLIEPMDAQAAGLPDGAAVRVSRVIADSPAAQAGLLAGDVLLAIQERDVHATADLFASIAELTPGSEIVVRVWRAGEVRDIPVRVIERTPMPETGGDVEGE